MNGWEVEASESYDLVSKPHEVQFHPKSPKVPRPSNISTAGPGPLRGKK